MIMVTHVMFSFKEVHFLDVLTNILMHMYTWL